MSDNKIENEIRNGLQDGLQPGTEYPLLSSGSDEPHLESDDGEISLRDAAVGLALYSASAALNTAGSVLRPFRRVGGFFFSPVKRAVNSSDFDRLVARGEAEVRERIQSGLAHEPEVRKAAYSALDPFVDEVVNYLSTQPAVTKLIKDQIDVLSKESRDMPQINVLVRVLADNYITYLNENPDQVKMLIQNQADVYMDHLSENPKQVQELVQGQSLSMAGEIMNEVRMRLVTGDSALEALLRRLFRRAPRYELPEPSPEVQARAATAQHPEDFQRLRAMQNEQN